LVSRTFIWNVLEGCIFCWRNNFGRVLITHLTATYLGETSPNLLNLTKTWNVISSFLRTHIGEYAMPSLVAGLWVGAASHTFTDMAGTFIKSGKVEDFI
jgi:uncharacterized metal-binding protein